MNSITERRRGWRMRKQRKSFPVKFQEAFPPVIYGFILFKIPNENNLM
jgi:hypothetical protein